MIMHRIQDPGLESERSTLSGAERLLADIRSLAPDITARAAEIEVGRRIPPDLVRTLKTIGVFRMLAPRSYGGLELDFPAALEVFEVLASIDGSVGWTVMIGSMSAIFMSLLPQETYERVYWKGPDVIGAGSAQSAGTAEATVGGWRVNGRWPFASGCQHSEWMMALCVMTENGKPLLGATGEGDMPLVRGFVLPTRDWQIEDTWHVAGLKGTGSHHITLKDRLVPAANFFDPTNGVPCLPGPLYQAIPQILPLAHAAVALGMGEGALDDLVALANTGKQQLRVAVSMRDSETFQGQLGHVAAELRAARALLEAQSESHWHHSLAGTLKDDARLAESHLAATWISTTCVRAASACFALGGGSVLFETSPLQRRLRDLHASAQHAMVHQRHYASMGKLLLGGVDGFVAAQGLGFQRP